jgi:hypothetical protein
MMTVFGICILDAMGCQNTSTADEQRLTALFGILVERVSNGERTSFLPSLLHKLPLFSTHYDSWRTLFHGSPSYRQPILP